MKCALVPMATAALLLAGCASSEVEGADETTVSAACAAAFEEMKATVDELHAEGSYTDAEINAAGVPPLEDCSSAADWLLGVKANPGALGYTDASVVSEMDLQISCYSPKVESTPVCQDAMEQGMLEHTGW